MYCHQRSQYIRSNSKKNSFRGNYSRKYGRHRTELSKSTKIGSLFSMSISVKIYLILFRITFFDNFKFWNTSFSEICLIDDGLELCLSTKYNNYCEYVDFVHFYPNFSLLLCPLHGNLISCPYYHSLGIELFQFEFHQYVHLQYYCQW